MGFWLWVGRLVGYSMVRMLEREQRCARTNWLNGLLMVFFQFSFIYNGKYCTKIFIGQNNFIILCIDNRPLRQKHPNGYKSGIFMFRFYAQIYRKIGKKKKKKRILCLCYFMILKTCSPLFVVVPILVNGYVLCGHMNIVRFRWQIHIVAITQEYIGVLMAWQHNSAAKYGKYFIADNCNNFQLSFFFILVIKFFINCPRQNRKMFNFVEIW